MNRRRFAGLSIALPLGIAGCLHGDDESDPTDLAGDSSESEDGSPSGGFSRDRSSPTEDAADLTDHTPEVAVEAFLTVSESRHGERFLHDASQYDIELANFDAEADLRVRSTAIVARDDAQFVRRTLGGPHSLYDDDAIATITARQTAAVEATVSVGDEGKLTYGVLAAREGDAWRVVDIYDVVRGARVPEGTLEDARRSPERVVRGYFASGSDREAGAFLHSESLLELTDSEQSVADVDVVSIEMARENLDEDAIAATLSGVPRGYSEGAIETVAEGRTAVVAVGIAVQVEHRSVTVEARVLTATEAGDWSVVDIVDFQRTPLTTTEEKGSSGRR